MAIRPCDEGDDELARRGCFLLGFFGALTLVLRFFLQGFFCHSGLVLSAVVVDIDCGLLMGKNTTPEVTM